MWIHYTYTEAIKYIGVLITIQDMIVVCLTEYRSKNHGRISSDCKQEIKEIRTGRKAKLIPSEM